MHSRVVRLGDALSTLKAHEAPPLH
jgi:hypothetical protein